MNSAFIIYQWIKNKILLPCYRCLPKLMRKKIKRKYNKYGSKVWKYYTRRKLFPRQYAKYAKQPVKENKIVFIEIRVSVVSESFRKLYDTLAINYDVEIHTHFLCTGFVSRKEHFERCMAMIRDIADAKYVFLSDASDVLSCLPMRSESVITQTWHGCGAFKKFGRSTGDLIFGVSTKEQIKYPSYKNITNVTVSSPEVMWAYSEAMNIPLESGIIKATGVSRTDVFYDNDFIEKARQKMVELMPASKGKKVILYAPTFRGRVANAETSNELNLPMFFDAFSDEYIVLYKHHPLVRKLPQIPTEYATFAADFTKVMTIEELLCVSDICISDYSSLVFEYALFERPMLFFAYDIEEYSDWRGFYYDYNELTPGPVCKSNEEMIDYITNLDVSFDKQQVIDFREKFMSSCDGHATERILQLMLGDNLVKLKREPLPAYDYHLIPSPSDKY